MSAMPVRDDLLRVDGTGAVHPVGRDATQQLRPRQGDWRLIRSSLELIMARSITGPDAVLKLAGEIRTPVALCDIVALAAQSGWTGELTLVTAQGTRSFYFDSGTVIGASTNIAEERLGEMLYRFGAITRAQQEAIVQLSAEKGRRFGETALDLELIASEKLYAMMERQVEEIFFAAAHASDGSFCFFDRIDEKRILHRYRLNPSALLMEAARRMDEMSFFREKVPDKTYIPMRVPGKKPRQPDEDQGAVFVHIDGASSVADIGRATGKDEFEVTRALFQLVSGGCAFVVAPRPRGPEEIIATFNYAIAAVHLECDCAGKGKELREGLARFASDAGAFDLGSMVSAPLPDGTLKPSPRAQNVATLAGEDLDSWLVELMSDYIDFALFQAESLLDRDAHSKLQADVVAFVKPLRSLLDDAPHARRG